MARDTICCLWSSATECALARERAVAGTSDEIPECPDHGRHPDAESLEARRRRVIANAIRAGEDLLMILAAAKVRCAEALEDLRGI